MAGTFFIQTVGCQMNVLDSELVAADLTAVGYRPAAGLRQADVILLNTCSVRQHAEDKIYSALGRLKGLKHRHPQKIIAVLGCMAQKDRQLVFQRAPHVDLVVGPGQLGQLPKLLEMVASGAGPQMAVSLDRMAGNREQVRASFARFVPSRTQLRGDSTRAQAMVRAMFGCDQFCAYCIVPRVRGPEQSRPAAEIREEVQCLADAGCMEITLIGQTVNSYKDTSGPRTLRLADLLAMLHDIDGIRRLKFVTNHPKFMSDDLLAAVRDLPKVAPYLHVPAQSGATAVLERMRRGYSAEFYREMVARIRQYIPHASITSDFIVGYCGETEAEFQQTVNLVREARFRNSFIFKYSARPGTKAAELYADDVPEEIKRRRNNELLAVQNAISREDNQSWVGRHVEILVEGPSKVARKQAIGGETTQLVGRTICDRIVVFDGPLGLAGRLISVTIRQADAFTLFGQYNA